MGDQTKSIQILSIEHRKHNQLDIMYLHQLFIRNPQLGCLASHYKETLTIISLQNLGISAKAAPLCYFWGSFPEIGIVAAVPICNLTFCKVCKSCPKMVYPNSAQDML